MIKINDLRKELTNYLGHNNFMVRKHTMKHDGKKGYSLVVYGHGDKNNRKLPVFGNFAGLTVHIISDKANDHWFNGKSLGFRSYELLI